MALWKTFQQFLTKLNIFLPYALTVLCLGIYSKFKMYVYTHTHTHTHTHRTLHIDVYSSFTNNYQNLEETTISLSR